MLNNIDKILDNAQFDNEEDRQIVKKMLINMINFDKEILMNLKDKENICIAYKEDPILCLSDIQNASAKLSHIVPDNEIKKLGNDIYNSSSSIHHVIKNYANINSVGANRDATTFYGFCENCEIEFGQNFNIDNPSLSELSENPKYYLYKYLYRYLGREIRGTEIFLKKLEKLNLSNEKEMNLFFKKIVLTTYEDYIFNKKIILKDYKILFLEMNSNICKAKKGYIENKGLISYEVKEIKFEKNYGVIGQSLSFQTLNNDLKTNLPIFLLFLERDDRTIVYIMNMTNVDTKIKLKLPSNKNNDEYNILSILLFSFYNSQYLYFNNNFNNNIVDYLINHVNKNPICVLEDVEKAASNILKSLKKENKCLFPT